jgi:hypothetical protein
MALAYPYLYGSALDGKEMELEGPIKIEVDKLEDTGDDLKEGINAVEASRQLLKQSCH